MMSLSFRPALSLLAASGLAFLTMCGASAQQAQFSTAHRNSEHALSQSVTGGDAKLRSQLASGRTATSLVVADFDEDGTSDLVSGYAVGSGGALLLQRGNPHALAPTEAEFAAARMGQPIVPFASKSEAIKLPVHPDLVKTADIGGHGHSDILVAANGDTTVYLLRGDGKGNFAAPQALSLGGAVSSLTTWKGPEGANFIAAGVCGATGCGVEVLDREGAIKAFVATADSVTGMEIANLNNGRYLDIAAMTANNVLVLDGATLVSGSPQSTSLRVSGAAAVASGSFVYDLRGFGQIAVLGSDATLHVFARAGVDGRVPSPAGRRARRSPAAGRPSAASLAWTEAETVYNVGPGGTSAIMVRGRFSGGGYDDLAVMAGSQYITVAHPLTSSGMQRSTKPVVTVDSTSSTVKAAVATRVSPDARLGVVTAGGFQPNFTVPPSSRTMTVNSTTDAVPNTTTMNACKNGSAGCTLRAAIAVANADSVSNGTSHVDTININAGTYTITANNGAAGGIDVNGSFDQHFDVDGSVNFIGAGTATTIINANHVDKVFQLNSGVTTAGNTTSALDIYFSNLTIENGENKNDPNLVGSACAGNAFCDFYGGNIDYDSDGPGTLGFTNVVLTGGKIDSGDQGGGGLYVSNSFGQASAPGGLTEFDNSTISSNTAPFQGGAINMGDFTPLTLSSDTISGNSATRSGSSPGQGGGLWLQSNPNDLAVATTAITITNSTFSSNVADLGGAIWLDTSSPTISGSTFTGNTVGAYGGAVYIAGTDRTAAVNITTSSFTGNAITTNSADNTEFSGSPFATNGAAICTEGGPAADAINLIIHFSRFHGNTGGHATAIGIGCESNSASSQSVTVNATDNWWGCNGAATGTGCDTVLSSFSSGPTITLSPFTNLILNLTSTTPASGSSFTATGSLGQDSNSTVYSAANDAAYNGVAATLTITQNGGGVTNSSATALSNVASIATTATATAAGAGTAAVTVDGFTVSKPFTVVATETKLAYTSAPAPSITVGGNAGTVKVAIEDGSNNVATGDSTTVITLTVTGPSSYLQTYTATAASGVATFNLTGVAINNAGAYVYTASATSLTSAVANETVGAANQTITFTGLPATATFGSAGPYTLNGSASSGLPVSYSVSGPGSISGTTLTITGAGTVSVTASQGGNANYNAATPVTQTIIVSPSNQTINFTGLPTTATFGSAGPYTLNGSASSGLPVSYTVSGPGSISGTTLTITGAGTVSVTASQGGNANYNAATPVTQTIVVSPSNQTINFTGLPATANFGSAGPYTLNGSASSGLPVSYTFSGPASISGTTLTITGAGTVSVTASQAGNANYNAATPVTQTIVVSPGNQTINFTGLPATANFGSAGPYTLNGSASSGLPVSYTFSGPASISGTTLTITGAGTVSVTASQAGNANYNAATPVTQTIIVSPGNQTITFTGLPATATFGSAGPYTLNGSASSGLPVSYGVSGPATLSGTTLTITGAGTVSVTASQAGNANFNAATPVTQTIIVGKASQTITFTGLPANATFGLAGPYTLNGSASSGLPVSYNVSGPASLSGTTLTITGTGIVMVTASQAGDANFNAAAPVTQTIIVVANNGSVQLNTTAVLTKLASGGYMAVITVTNVGTGVAQNVDLTGATLGSATGTPLPAMLGTLAPSGGSASATVTFPASAGSSGTATVERFTGTYTGGTFGGSFRATLP